MRKLLVGYFFSLLVLIVIAQISVAAAESFTSENANSALQRRDNTETAGDEFLIKKPKSSNHLWEYLKIDATEIREQEEDDEKELNPLKKCLEQGGYPGVNQVKIAALRKIATAERDFSYLTESERYLLILVFRI